MKRLRRRHSSPSYPMQKNGADLFTDQCRFLIFSLLSSTGSMRRLRSRSFTSAAVRILCPKSTMCHRIFCSQDKGSVDDCIQRAVPEMPVMCQRQQCDFQQAGMQNCAEPPCAYGQFAFRVINDQGCHAHQCEHNASPEKNGTTASCDVGLKKRHIKNVASIMIPYATTNRCAHRKIIFHKRSSYIPSIRFSSPTYWWEMITFS